MELVGKGSPVDCATALNEVRKGPPGEPAINDMITRTRTIANLFLDKLTGRLLNYKHSSSLLA